VPWRVEFDKRAKREFDELELSMRRRVFNALERLSHDPFRSPNVKALHGGGYRLRVGSYRVLYELRHDILVVLVVQVVARKDAY
jgi:mRNA interferase RelE/StbE